MIKQIFIALIILAAFEFSVKAQYSQQEWIISPKISFADYSDKNDYADYSISKIPPLSIFVEKGINSFFSAGGFMGYNRDKYVNDTLSSNILKYRTFMTGVVATVHYAHWIERLSGYNIFLGDFDLYISGAAQLAFNKTDEKQVWDPENERYNDNKGKEVVFRIRPIFGIRYFLTDRFCMHLEAGRGNPGKVTTGVSWFLD
ncbi:outer membrane beta-barrel protein [Thermophagus sp. OGC60D27]|uniref:outer membrane beta-barrel protein n=1 Tax=Thermophagus sp. OGC60D27 TaxID=3458415 RepID=UPI004037B004